MIKYSYNFECENSHNFTMESFTTLAPPACPHCGSKVTWCNKADTIQVTNPTDEDYSQHSQTMLKRVPEELRCAIAYMAYERGHSAGQAEIALILEGLVNDLEEPLKKLVERLSTKAA